MRLPWYMLQGRRIKYFTPKDTSYHIIIYMHHLSQKTKSANSTSKCKNPSHCLLLWTLFFLKILYLCVMKNQGQLALAQLILPSEILSNFEVVCVEEEASLIRIYLDESVKADYKENPLIESKRFCDAVTIRNFQSFREKILEKGEEKEKKQAAPGIESRLLILSLFDEANAYFLFISHFAVPSAQLTTSLMS